MTSGESEATPPGGVIWRTHVSGGHHIIPHKLDLDMFIFVYTFEADNLFCRDDILWSLFFAVSASISCLRRCAGVIMQKKGGECVDYCARMLSVTSTNELPAMLTMLNFCFMSLDTPVEKHASSSCIYSLNVVPHHRPIFLYLCIAVPCKG